MFRKISILLLITFLLTGCQLDKQKETVVSNKSEKREVNDLKVASEPSQQIINQNTMIPTDEDKILAVDQQPQLLNSYSQATLVTNKGNITVKFYSSESPQTVNNFLYLAQKNFYNKTKFHRVIKDFMIQGGDPNSKDSDRSNDGMGNPGYAFKDEFNDHKLVQGSLAMANAGPNSNGSQFFIVTAAETPWLDKVHTNFGYVSEGMDIVNLIANSPTGPNDYPVEDIVIEKIILK